MIGRIKAYTLGRKYWWMTWSSSTNGWKYKVLFIKLMRKSRGRENAVEVTLHLHKGNLPKGSPKWCSRRILHQQKWPCHNQQLDQNLWPGEKDETKHCYCSCFKVRGRLQHAYGLYRTLPLDVNLTSVNMDQINNPTGAGCRILTVIHQKLEYFDNGIATRLNFEQASPSTRHIHNGNDSGNVMFFNSPGEWSESQKWQNGPVTDNSAHAKSPNTYPLTNKQHSLPSLNTLRARCKEMFLLSTKKAGRPTNSCCQYEA